jgi:hypothetical protein
MLWLSEEHPINGTPGEFLYRRGRLQTTQDCLAQLRHPGYDTEGSNSLLQATSGNDPDNRSSLRPKI